MNGTVKGYLLGIIAAITYGMNPLFGLHLYRDGLLPGSVLFYRFLFASILLGGIMLIRKDSFRLPKHQFFHVLAGGLLLAASCNTWYLSFQIMDSGIGAAIMFVYPIMVAAIMVIGFKEKLTGRTIAGVLLALIGVAVLCRPGEGAKINVAGVVYVLISSLTYAVYIVEVKVSRLKEMQPETLTFYAMVIGCLYFLVFLGFGRNLQMLPSFTALGNALGLAFFPSLLSFLLMAIAIRYIGATKTAILGALEPATAVCIGLFVFGEKFTWPLLIGIILVMASVMTVIAGGKEKSA